MMFYRPKLVPWQSMLRYLFITIPLFIISLVIFLKYQEIPFHLVLWSFLGLLILFGLAKFPKLSFPIKVSVIYIFLALIAEVIAREFAIEFKKNSPVYHVLMPIQIFFYAIVYFKFLGIQKTNKHYWMIVSIPLIATLGNSLFFQSIWDFPSINFIFLSALVLPLTLLYFRRMILNPISIKLENQAYFWFNIGTFVFFTLDFFILGFHASLKLDVPPWIYDILWGANLALYIPYFIAIILDAKPKTAQT
ncbi:MAG: hypothetical protein COA99_19020 [Moraxellaceae bacterium]|nr:MAG: hypothetical protein COA99_19020 [Moraxellaceae bacterium]